MLGSQRRLVRRCECDTDLPKPGPFPQISQTAAMVKLLEIGSGGPATESRVTRQPLQDTGRHGERKNRPLARHRRAAGVSARGLSWSLTRLAAGRSGEEVG